MTCLGIEHDWLGECGDKTAQCVICAGPYKSENHKRGVTGCILREVKSVRILCLNAQIVRVTIKQSYLNARIDKKQRRMNGKKRHKNHKIKKVSNLSLMKSKKIDLLPNLPKWSWTLILIGLKVLKSHLQILVQLEMKS